MPVNELSDKQLRFCQEYVIDHNGTQAAIRAGYSPHTAKVQAARLLTKATILKEVGRMETKISERLDIDAIWVAKRLKEISDRCMQAEPVLVWDGKEWVPSGEYRFDSAGANKSTELLGKHLGFFKEDNSQKVPTEIIFKREA
jgi:phage terminase small subunit